MKAIDQGIEIELEPGNSEPRSTRQQASQLTSLFRSPHDPHRHTRPTPRPSSTVATAADGGNGDAYKAALRGASLAFQNTGSKPSQSAAASASQGRSVDNGALIAATSTSHHHGLGPSRSPPRPRTPGTVSRQTTGSSSAQSSRTSGVGGGGGHEHEHGSAAQRNQKGPQQSIQQQGLAAAHLLTPPGKQHAPDAKSPSFIAATLAASRSGSPNPRPPPQPAAKRQQGSHAIPQDTENSTESTDLATDTRSLSSTNTLISMFEKKDDNTDPVKKRVVTTDDSRPSVSTSKPKPKPKPKPKSTPQARPETPPEAPISEAVSDAKSLASPLELTGARARAQELPASPTISVKKQRKERPERLLGIAGEAESSKKRPPTPPAPRSTKNGLGEPPAAIKPSTPKKKPRAYTPPRKVSNANVDILSPQPRRASSQKILSHRSSSEDAISPQIKAPLPAMKPKPRQRAPADTSDKSSIQLGKPTQSTVPAVKERQSSTSSNETFVSASSVPPSPEPGSPPQQPRRKDLRTPDPPRPRRPASTQSTTSARPRGHPSPLPAPPLPQRPQQNNTDLSLASLTSAIVAGSLASQRALTPSTSTSRTSLHPQTSQPQLKKPPSPPSRRQTPRIRQTLRKPDRDEGEAGGGSRRQGSEGHGQKPKHRHGKGLFGGNSNKHSHHEGQRRRWREEITPRERKRYEGVWASNRGYLMELELGSDAAGADAGADLVSGIVVRDIWARSRLPVDELAEVWDLVVDHRSRGGGAGGGGARGSSDEDRGGGTRLRDRALDRTEFVVGMWLVDQRLRGRKIPPKVSDSVWGSARGGGVVGVSVKRPKGSKR